MPPRTRARASAARASDPLAVLPLSASRCILSLLPVDSRAKAACVARSWRAALADPALWARLDLSSDCGVARTYRQDGALLLGAAGRALGQLCHLDVTGVYVPTPVLLEVLAANAGSLRTLRVSSLTANPGQGHPLTLDAVLAAAPSLQVLEGPSCISCHWDAAPRLVRLRVLRLNDLFVHFQHPLLGGLAQVGPLAEALSDAELQPTLSRVSCSGADVARPEVLDAIVDAALTRRLPGLCFTSCSPPAVAPLVRLLAGGTVTNLQFGYTRGGAALLDGAGSALVAEALRANTSLTELTLMESGVYRDAHAATTLLGALVGHPSLRLLTFQCETGGTPAARGALMAALIAADAPALQSLYNYCATGGLGCTCPLRDAGLAPLCAALARNRHLRHLDLTSNDMSERFAREQLLPAVRANVGLLELSVDSGTDDEGAAAREAMDLVAGRPGAPPRDDD